MFTATQITTPLKQVDSSSEEEEDWPPPFENAGQTEFYEVQLVREVPEGEHIRERVYFLVKYVPFLRAL